MSDDRITTVAVTAALVDEPERSIYRAEHAARFPGFAQHQSRTTRVIPFVALKPRSATATP